MADDGDDAVGDLDVLIVCTANICRSPMAERLMRRELALCADPEVASWRVASAGVDAAVGVPIHPHAAAALAEVGVEVGESAARLMDRKEIERSKLILTATRWHRSRVVEVAPRAVRRVFTMRQFARMCLAGSGLTEIDPTGDVESLIAVAQIGRTGLQPMEDDAIEDPFGGDLDQFRTCRDLIAVSLEWILTPFAVA